jgi:hypothetical protein
MYCKFQLLAHLPHFSSTGIQNSYDPFFHKCVRMCVKALLKKVCVCVRMRVNVCVCEETFERANACKCVCVCMWGENVCVCVCFVFSQNCSVLQRGTFWLRKKGLLVYPIVQSNKTNDYSNSKANEKMADRKFWLKSKDDHFFRKNYNIQIYIVILSLTHTLILIVCLTTSTRVHNAFTRSWSS